MLLPRQFKRYVLAPNLPRSQHKTNQLWQPEVFHLGETYAAVLKTVAMALVYSPLQPLCLVVAPLALLGAYLCLNFALCHWYAPPSQLTDELTNRMRHWLGFVMLLRFVVEGVGSSKAVPSRRAYTQLIIGLSLNTCLLLATLVLPLGRYFPALERYRYEAGNTDPVAYDQVHHLKGITLAPYECPALGGGRDAAALVNAHAKAESGRFEIFQSGSPTAAPADSKA